jgi:alginate O-acetyltransferase complex protein AlgI
VSLFSLIIVIFASLLIGLLAKGKWHSWCLLVASILAIYWLQPATPIRHLDFWLPTACLILTILTWILTKPKDAPDLRSNLKAGLVIAAAILLIGLTRYLGPACCLTPTRPPALYQIVLVFVAVALIVALATRYATSRVAWIYGSIILIIVLFVIQKSEPLAELVSMGLRSMNAQSVNLASAIDIRWLGFSYVAFRLMHTLRDRVSGRLPDLTLMEYLTYVIFFPAYIAGPIDRVQRFIQNLHQPFHLTFDATLRGGKRILLGIFCKFVLADGLALIALNSNNSSQVHSTGWLWVMLYAYALRIFFDFSGYTDIAIGMGQLLGIQLPENFDRPYLKQNLTLFWNSWHMTLAQWFRAYFFNPLTRALRSDPRNIPLPLIIFIGQLSTFILIGLWHGISWNYAIWGAWHGFGLFIHNRWSDLIRSKVSSLDSHPLLKRLVGFSSTAITFHYVSLGWVWFALSTPTQSWNTFLTLFGLG